MSSTGLAVARLASIGRVMVETFILRGGMRGAQVGDGSRLGSLLTPSEPIQLGANERIFIDRDDVEDPPRPGPDGRVAERSKGNLLGG